MGRRFVAGSAGALELLLEPPAGTAPRAVVVLCHPHPLYGGSLRNKVVDYLARTCRERGLASIRFNFRGVGASEGVYDEGRGETEDLAAVRRWAGAQPGLSGLPLWLAGFSFGGAIAWRAARQEAPARLITVAPAVRLLAGSERATPRGPDCPWLLIQGWDDEVVSPQAVLDWAGRQRPPPRLVTPDGVGHFFHGRLNLLRQLLLEHID